jgi:hypothetical protein
MLLSSSFQRNKIYHKVIRSQFPRFQMNPHFSFCNCGRTHAHTTINFRFNHRLKFGINNSNLDTSAPSKRRRPEYMLSSSPCKKETHIISLAQWFNFLTKQNSSFARELKRWPFFLAFATIKEPLCMTNQSNHAMGRLSTPSQHSGGGERIFSNKYSTRGVLLIIYNKFDLFFRVVILCHRLRGNLIFTLACVSSETWI